MEFKWNGIMILIVLLGSVKIAPWILKVGSQTFSLQLMMKAIHTCAEPECLTGLHQPDCQHAEPGRGGAVQQGGRSHVPDLQRDQRGGGPGQLPAIPAGRQVHRGGRGEACGGRASRQTEGEGGGRTTHRGGARQAHRGWSLDRWGETGGARQAHRGWSLDRWGGTGGARQAHRGWSLDRWGGTGGAGRAGDGHWAGHRGGQRGGDWPGDSCRQHPTHTQFEWRGGGAAE